MIGHRKWKYEAVFVRNEGDACLYRITEIDDGRPVRTLAGRVPASQRAAAKGWENNADERKVERWCELKQRQGKLPVGDEIGEINLNEVMTE